MSRFCGSVRIEEKFNVIEQWRSRCLLGGGSLFTELPVWNVENLASIKKYFVDNLDTGEGNFIGKLEKQMAPAPVESKILCAEMLWVMLLCPSNIKPPSKRATINRILGWADTEIPPDSLFTTDVAISGFGSGGVGYNNFRWKELVYWVRLLEQFYQLDRSQQRSLALDCMAMTQWLESIPDNENRQFRHMLLFMLFPDDNERIFGTNDRLRVAMAFGGGRRRDYRDYSARELDELLGSIRKNLEAEYNTNKLDWYVPPVKALWQPTSKKGTANGATIFEFLESFLEQSKTDDMTTRDYARLFNGFEMRINFVAGDKSDVAWVAFLGKKQSPVKGIYPLYLHCKAAKLLLLVRGIGRGQDPDIAWPESAVVALDTLSAFEGYFDISNVPVHSAKSYVYKKYDLSKPLAEDEVVQDLMALCAEYGNLAAPLEINEPEADYDIESEEGEDSETSAEEGTLDTEDFSLANLMQDLFLPEQKINDILDLLRRKKNIVLQGPPGVGKTFVSKRLAYGLMGEKAAHRVGMAQFHQSFAYEDFMQGYRPDGAGFSLKNGIFYQFCNRADMDRDSEYVFIIDEINRGNLSRIFGELMMLIEADKRGPEWAIPLTYGAYPEETFYIPSNVHIIGLMNTADRSLAMVDYALRRRFAFVDLRPEFDSPGFITHLKNHRVSEALGREIIEKMTRLNSEIAADTANLGPGYCIGHSFFCLNAPVAEAERNWYERVIRTEIEPLLREYWFDDLSRAEDHVKNLLTVD